MTSAKKVLVIDEDEDHLMICRLELEHRGYEVLGVRGFEQSDHLFETVYSFRPDVILIDQHDAAVNSADIIVKLKEVPEFAQVSVIGILGAEEQPNLVRKETIDDYLTKPLKIADLLFLLAKYTGSDVV